MFFRVLILVAFQVANRKAIGYISRCTHEAPMPGENMGRPKSENPLTERFVIKMDAELREYIADLLDKIMQYRKARKKKTDLQPTRGTASREALIHGLKHILKVEERKAQQ
jgi:hypothetical protein